MYNLCVTDPNHAFFILDIYIMMDLTPIYDILKELRNTYAGLVDGEGHTRTGRLGNDIKFDVSIDEADYVVTISLQDYWKYLECGTYDRFKDDEILQRIVGGVSKALPRTSKPKKGKRTLPTPRGIQPTFMLKRAMEATNVEKRLRETIIELIIEDATKDLKINI